MESIWQIFLTAPLERLIIAILALACWMLWRENVRSKREQESNNALQRRMVALLFQTKVAELSDCTENEKTGQPANAKLHESGTGGHE